MSKISKSIKRHRILSGMTQEELAIKIHVTRQTVSSWETDRTQPDLETLGAIARVFEVEPEELVYGKRKSRDENSEREKKERLVFGNTLVTVLSVIGCLLIGVGVVLLIATCWENLPKTVKVLTCFVPWLAGFAVGAYTYFKRKESQPWCEGATVLWLLGVVVTSALTKSQIDFISIKTSFICLLVAVSAFALMWLFRAIAPLVGFYISSITWFVFTVEEQNIIYYGYLNFERDILDMAEYILLVIVEVLFIGAVFYLSSKLCKKEENIIRYTFCQWLNCCGLAVFLFFAVSNTAFSGAYFSLLALGANIYFIIGQRQEGFVSPYNFFGTLGSAAMLFMFAVAIVSDDSLSHALNVAVLLICLVPLYFLLDKRTRPQNLYLRLYGILLNAVIFVFNVIRILNRLTRTEEDGIIRYDADYPVIKDILSGVIFVLCVAALIMLIVYGARERRLLYLNLGFVASCLCVVGRLYFMELSLVAMGIILILSGVGLLLVNLKISRKKPPLEDAEEEVSS